MSYATYAQPKRRVPSPVQQQRKAAVPGPSLDALRAGSAPSAEQMGRRVDLPEAIRAKMESSFGADLSSVKLYESETVKEAGAQAVTRGSDIAFAPGVLDFTSFGGQALLGHELSHVLSQRRGEARGSGFLNSVSLESRADAEGERAASGGSVAAMPTASLSQSGAASAAGPMQAKKPPRNRTNPAQQTQQSQQSQQQPEEDSDDDTALEKLMESGDSVTDKGGNIADAVKTFAPKTAGDELTRTGKAAEAVSDEMGLANSSIGALKGINDLGKSFADAEEARETGHKGSLANARFDTAESTMNLGKSSAGMAKGIAAKIGKTAISEGADLAGNIFGVAGGGVGMLKAAYNFSDATVRRARMGSAADKLRKKQDMSDQDREMTQIYRQGGRNARVQQISSGFKGVSSALGVAGGVAGMAGAEPAAAALNVGGMGVEMLGDVVTGYETDKFHRATVDDKTGAKGDIAELRSNDRYKLLRGLDTRLLRQASARNHGAASGSDDEMFQNITTERADMLTQNARAGDAEAQKYARIAGVDYNAEKAKKGFQKSLGLEQTQDYNSMSALEYNAFAEGEKAEAERKKANRGFWGEVGHRAGTGMKKLGSSVWGSVKGLGSNVANIAKGVGRGFKSVGTGAVSAVKGMHKFRTDAQYRADKLAAMKTGAGNAVSAVGRGFKSIGSGIAKAAGNTKRFFTDADYAKETLKTGASKVGKGLANAALYPARMIGHYAAKGVNSVRDWYTQGVDQLNLNRASYEKMNSLDKAAWTMKNLPARLMASRQKDSTVRRYNRLLNAQDVMKDIEARRLAAQAAQAAAPAQSEGRNTSKETWDYRNDEIGALAADPSFVADPTSSDRKHGAVIARRYYDKLKGFGKDADPEEVARARQGFVEARKRLEAW